MAFVGKKFPNISVNAMNDMGDTFKLNVLEEAQKNIKEFKTIIAEKDKQIEMLNRKNNTLQGFVVKLTYAQEEKTEDNHHHSQSTCQPGHSFF